MARDIVLTVYPFEELDSDAQQRAYENWLSGGVWHWGDDWAASIKNFCEIAPIGFISADYAAGHVDVNWSEKDSYQNDNGRFLAGIRAWKWLHNNGWHDLSKANADGACTLTGYCGDCPPFDVIKAYCEGDPRLVPDLEQVFYEAAQAWAHAARKDLEYSESLDAFKEVCEGNEYEFDIEGSTQ